MQSEQSRSGAGAVLIAAVLWGTVGPAQVVAGSSADPGALGVARLLVGGMILALPMAWSLPWKRLLRRDVLPWMLAAAALGTVIALGCAPVATGVFAWWWLRERPAGAWLAGTADAIVGCALVLLPSGGGQVDVLGVAFAVVSGVCYGAYTVAAKKFLSCDVPPTATVTATLLLGGILLSPLLIVFPSHLFGANSLALIAWLGIGTTAVAYMCFVSGLRRISAANAGTLSLAEPLTAAMLGVLVLGERLTVPATAGCLLLLAGLIIVSIDVRRTRSRLRSPAVTKDALQLTEVH